MKRGVFGVCLLAGLLLLGLLVTAYAARRLDPIADDLELALQAADLGQGQKAAALADKARAAWEDCRNVFSCLSQQEDIHRIDRLYVQLENCSRLEAYGDLCRMLRDLTQELREDQTLRLPHLL